MIASPYMALGELLCLFIKTGPELRLIVKVSPA